MDAPGEAIDDPWESEFAKWLCEPPRRAPVVRREHAKSIVATNDSPDIPFRFGANPYRGCAHGCAYCYARPTHEYLDLDADLDFETVLVAKVNAAELLARELAAPRLAGEVLCISGITDPYQPIEATLGLSRAMLEVCVRRHQPVLVFTKAALVQRDVDLLAALARGPGVQVYLSIPFADPVVARALEPHAPSPAARLRAMAVLAAAGVPVGLSLAPLVPGLNDRDIAKLLAAAAEAGAQNAFTTFLRLPGSVSAIFERRLRERLPDAADRVLGALRDAGLERPHRAAFGERMVGRGPRWQVAMDLFHAVARRHGLASSEEPRPFLPPRRGAHQPLLFE